MPACVIGAETACYVSVDVDELLLRRHGGSRQPAFEQPWFASRRQILSAIYAFDLFCKLNILLKSKSDYKLATSSLNMISALLVVSNVGYIAYHEYKVGAILGGIFQNDDKELAAIHLKKTKSLEDSPDIYYFILDAFGRSDTLKEVYDFDNSSFIDGLKQSGGFVVPSGSSTIIR